jgi:hypothetical protein
MAAVKRTSCCFHHPLVRGLWQPRRSPSGPTTPIPVGGLPALDRYGKTSDFGAEMQRGNYLGEIPNAMQDIEK